MGRRRKKYVGNVAILNALYLLECALGKLNNINNNCIIFYSVSFWLFLDAP